VTLSLIDKQDTVEIVRDQIAAILAIESASQVAQAITAGKPAPNNWKLRVYQERSNPWDIFMPDQADNSPVVNVWWDSATYDKKASNIFERQKTDARINVDCYGYGISADDLSGGHVAGDQSAAESVQRAVRLVRNILMSAEYTYLALQGTVWSRWPSSVSIFQPQQGGQNVSQVVGARIVFDVEFNEHSPQFDVVELELLTVAVSRAEDGQIVINADYDYT